MYVHTFVSEKQSSFTKEHLELQVGLLELCLGLPELFVHSLKRRTIGVCPILFYLLRRFVDAYVLVSAIH